MKRKLAFLLLSSLHYKNRNLKAGDRGFTLIEVIVAIVILSVFIVASLSALVAGLNLKLKAKLNNEATLLIQQDLEKVRYTATQFGMGTINATPTTSSTSNPLALTISINPASSTTIPLSPSGSTVYSNYLYTADNPTADPVQLNVSNEASAYTLTSIPAATGSTPSVAVTLDAAKTTTSSTKLTVASTASPNITVTVSDVSKFQPTYKVVVGPNSSGTTFVGTISTVSTVISGTPPTQVVTFTSNVGTGYPKDTPVTVLPKSGDVIANTELCLDGTIASKFVSFVPDVTGSSTTFNGREYRLTRTATAAPEPTSAVPSALSKTRVQIKYKVAETTSLTACLAQATEQTACLAILTTEVIPSVTFQCP